MKSVDGRAWGAVMGTAHAKSIFINQVVKQMLRDES